MDSNFRPPQSSEIRRAWLWVWLTSRSPAPWYSILSVPFRPSYVGAYQVVWRHWAEAECSPTPSWLELALSFQPRPNQLADHALIWSKFAKSDQENVFGKESQSEINQHTLKHTQIAHTRKYKINSKKRHHEHYSSTFLSQVVVV